MHATPLSHFRRAQSHLGSHSLAGALQMMLRGPRAYDVVRVLRSAGVATLVCGALLAAGCSSSGGRFEGDGNGGKAGYSPRVTPLGAPVPPGGGRRKLGNPYVVAGVTYVPRHEPDYDRVGVASWYGEDFHGRLTANGEVYDMHGMSAAHPTLPLPSFVRVTSAGLRESHVHDVQITKEAPNYRID